MPASLGFMLEAILGVMGSQSKLNSGILSVRLSMGSLVFIAKCSVRSSCFFASCSCEHVVLSHPILCPVVLDWWAEADCMWENSEGFSSKSSLEWASCSLILLIKGL